METEVHYRLMGMPDGLIVPVGCTVEFVVTDVAPMEDGAVEVVMRYDGHA